MEREMEVQVVVLVPLVVNTQTGAVAPNGRPYVGSHTDPSTQAAHYLLAIEAVARALR